MTNKGKTSHPSTRPIIEALEAAWSHAQASLPAMEIPPVVIVLGSGTTGRRAVRGHFAAGRWAQGKTQAHHEVLIAGERLADGPEAVLATLLHEASHAGCHALGIEDTSRNGRYHNKRFEAAAQSLGLTTDKHPSVGIVTTGIDDETRTAYAKVLEALAAAIDLYRHSEIEAVAIAVGKGGSTTAARAPKARKSNNGQSLSCSCETPRRIRVSDSTADLGPIVCGICEEAFA